jgi:ABC-type glycerol-3-phosphate transport system substrate-binding protein
MSSTKSNISRREMLKLTCIGAGGLALAGCVSPTQTSNAVTAAATTGVSNKVESGAVRFRIETGTGKDFEDVISAFQKEYPSIELEFTQIDPTSAGSQWARLAVDQGLVDLVSNENPKFLYLDPKISAGMLQPLDQYAELYNWKDIILPEAIKRSSRSGKLWTIPAYYEICGIAYKNQCWKV